MYWNLAEKFEIGSHTLLLTAVTRNANDETYTTSISPKGCFPVISTPDAKNAFIKIVILTEYMYNALKLPKDVIRFRTFRF